EFLRRLPCDGPLDADTLPPERRDEILGVKDPIPLALEARHGGLIQDGRGPAGLLGRGTWTVTTLELEETTATPAAHVQERGELLLIVERGIVEIWVQGRPITDLYSGSWVYLPAKIPHTVAVLERARVTMHLSDAEACPQLDARRPPDREAIP